MRKMRANAMIMRVMCMIMFLMTSVASAMSQTDSTNAETASYALRDKVISLAPKTIITNTRMLGIGTVDILDTYLSPEKYTGIELRFISHTIRRKGFDKISRGIIHQGSISRTENRAGTATEMAGMYSFGYAWYYNRDLLDMRLNIRAGCMIDANAGFIYNTRNGNNPAQARLFMNITPTVAASYCFDIGNHPFAVNYELAVPLLGLMFSPAYGQSYYEIFSEGNYDHNIVPTTFVSAPSMRQMLTFDFTLLRTVWRIGYLGDMYQAKPNNLKTHFYTHSIIIGMVKRFSIVK